MNDFDQRAPTYDDNPMRSERARAVAEGIRAGVALHPGMTALEYGCGTGLLSFALQPYLGHITLADSSSGMLGVVAEKIAASGSPNLTPLQLDLARDPLPPMRVELIYTLLALHHILETGLVLERFYALLESPGILCVADLDSEDGHFHGPGFIGHTGFERGDFAAMVEKAGFRNPRFTTVYRSPRVVEGVTRYYPVFLMIAEK